MSTTDAASGLLPQWGLPGGTPCRPAPRALHAGVAHGCRLANHLFAALLAAGARALVVLWIYDTPERILWRARACVRGGGVVRRAARDKSNCQAQRERSHPASLAQSASAVHAVPPARPHGVGFSYEPREPPGAIGTPATARTAGGGDNGEGASSSPAPWHRRRPPESE